MEQMKCQDIVCQCGSSDLKVQELNTFKDGILEPVRGSYSISCARCGEKIKLITCTQFFVYGK